MLLDSLSIDPAELEQRTGWAVKPEGACKGQICVPLPSEARVDGRIDGRVLAERLGMPLIEDETSGRWALGPETGGRALTSAAAPELVLPDWQGQEFRLSSLFKRGQKVLLVAWASW